VFPRDPWLKSESPWSQHARVHQLLGYGFGGNEPKHQDHPWYPEVSVRFRVIRGQKVNRIRATTLASANCWATDSAETNRNIRITRGILTFPSVSA